MRFFAALEIPEDSKAQISRLQDQLNQMIPGLRLTDPKKLHLTIAFIGEQEASLQKDLERILTEATVGIGEFNITPSIIDGFPNIHHPQTIFLGVKGDTDKLAILRERVKDESIRLGIQVDERRFVPHIAIAKTDHLTVLPEMEAKLQELMLDSNMNPIKVSSIKLFESVPDHDFHTHNTLFEVNLS